MIFLQKQQHRRRLQFSDSIKQNLSLIHTNLQKSLHQQLQNPLQISDSEDSENQQKGFSINSKQQKLISQNIQLLKHLFQYWQKDQIKSMIVYNKLIFTSKKIEYHKNILFTNTLFQQNLWPLLTLYLQKQLRYNILRTNNQKIVDIWYQYLVIQEKNQFQQIIFKHERRNFNLGQWFKRQCLELLFQKFYLSNKNQYTKFFVDFFLYGLAYIFYQSIFILNQLYPKKDNYQINVYQQNQKIKKIKSIQYNYLEKFNILKKK